MTWSSWHRQSEELASESHLLMRQGKSEEAILLFGRAAEAENQALLALDPTKKRTIGITAVSAVSLWFKGRQYAAAEAAAIKWLASDQLPQFAIEQLKTLLQSIWTSQAMKDTSVSFLPGQVLVAVRGGQTISGGAPLDLIVEKVQTVQALFYRTIEHIKGRPHRKRGAPSHEIQEACRPWLLQAPPGSYQFSVAIQEPKQPDFFKDAGPNPKEIAHHFMSILRATSENPSQELPKLIPSEEYRTTFLKLARNLSPTGKNFSEVEVRGSDEIHGISLGSESRKTINRVLRPPEKKVESADYEEVELRGILRALHLEKDWLEIIIEDEPVRIDGLSEAIDDVIGPMVNRPVVVRVSRRIGKTTKYKFLDIESDD